MIPHAGNQAYRLKLEGCLWVLGRMSYIMRTSLKDTANDVLKYIKILKNDVKIMWLSYNGIFCMGCKKKMIEF